MEISAHAEGRAPGGASARNARKRNAAKARRLAPVVEPQDDSEAPTSLRVAVLDSDSGFLVVLANRMQRLGWKHRVLSPRGSAKTLSTLQADVLILDVSILGTQRWKRLGRLCQERPDLRVIVCTGTSTVAERVCALRLGADDWLSKPCHPEELIARVEAITTQRRRREQADPQPATVGEVEIRPDLYQA